MAKLEYTLSLPDANYILHEMSLALIYGNVDYQHDYSSITIFVFIKSQSVIVISSNQLWNVREIRNITSFT